MTPLTLEEFQEIYDSIKIQNDKRELSFKLGIDVNVYSAGYNNVIFKLLLKHFSQEQIDFIKWSIFEKEPDLPVEDGSVRIDNATICFEYLTKLQEAQQ